MLGSLGAPELIIIALVLVLLFGVGKLSGLGKGLGDSIKEFRKAVKDPEGDEKPGATPPAATQQATTQAPPAATPPAATPPAEPQKPNIF